MQYVPEEPITSGIEARLVGVIQITERHADSLPLILQASQYRILTLSVSLACRQPMPAPLPMERKPAVVQPVTPPGPPTAAMVLKQRMVAAITPVHLVGGKYGQPVVLSLLAGRNEERPSVLD